MSTEIHTQKKTLKKEQSKDWRLLEFFVPIEEKLVNDKDEFMIRGVAINETTTLNNVKYVAEELEKAAPSFRNVPILLDHKNEVKNIVGRTTEGVAFNPAFKRIEFEAKIMDKDIKEMIKDGRIGSVSIGAKVQDLTEEEDGSQKALGIKGLEISLVAVPGDSEATFAHAIQQSVHLREMVEKKLNKEEILMAEDEVKSEETKTPEASETPEATEKPEEEKKEEVVEEEKEEVKEEKAQNINVSVDTSEMASMKEQIAELKGLLIEKKKITEQVEEEKEEAEEKEDETKGEVSEEKVKALEKVNNLIMEKSQNGYSLYRDYSLEDADTNLKRLVR